VIRAPTATGGRRIGGILKQQRRETDDHSDRAVAVARMRPDAA